MKRKLIILSILTFSTALLGAMPPHPKVLDQYRETGNINSLSRTISGRSVTDMNQPVKSFPLTGIRKVLVLVAGFSDASLDQASTQSFYKTLFEGVDDQALSLRKYYYDMSGGKLILNFDVFTVGNVSRTKQYYGENTSPSGGDAHPGEFVAEAVDLGDSAGIDYTLYDNDGDGYVDAVIVIHQGQGEEFSGSTGTSSYNIWSHRWTLSSADFFNGGNDGYNDIASDPDGDGVLDYDGVKINDFTIQPEYLYAAGDSTIGVFAHEFGHILGLPDLYDTSYTTEGIGNWGLMGGGAWLGPKGLGSQPAPMSAWSRAALGWMTVSSVTAKAPPSSASQFRNKNMALLEFITLPTAIFLFLIQRVKRKNRSTVPGFAALGTLLLLTIMITTCGQKGSLFSIDLADAETSLKSKHIGINLSEYLLLENKVKRVGTWTEYLPGEGLLIFHIDTDIINDRFTLNQINDYTINGKIGVAVVEADNGNNLLGYEPTDQGSPTDPFYLGNVDFLSGLTANSGEKTGFETLNIGYPGTVISFDVYKE